MIDLMELAAEARWESSQLWGAHSGRRGTIARIPFDGSMSDRRGCVRRDRIALENGTTQEVLFTHPQWAAPGTVKGWFPWQAMPERPVFHAQVGFAAGAAGSDGVRFQVWEHHRRGGREVWSRLGSVTKALDSRLVDFEVDLTHLAGQDVQIELRVDTGDQPAFRTVPSSSGQDWACWVAPRIEDDTARPRASVWDFGPTRMRVLDRTERAGGGDDPYLGGVYFRTVVGVPGSTRVVPLDELRQIADDVSPGDGDQVIHRLMTRDAAAARPLDLTDMTGLTLFGVGLSPIEEDMDNRNRVRPRVHTLATRLRRAIRQTFERRTTWSPLEIGLAVNTLRTQMVNNTLPAPDIPSADPSGGGFSLLEGLGWFWGRLDDSLGEVFALGWGVSPRDFDQLNGLLGNRLVDGEELVHFPLSPATKTLTARGDDGVWEIDIELSSRSRLDRLTTDL